MKIENKRLAAIIGCAVVVGAIIGVGGYILISPKTSTVSLSSGIPPVSTTSSIIVTNSSSSAGASTSAGNNSSTPAPVDMSDWKMYTNYELGFSFEYPPDLKVDTSNPAAVELTFPSSYFSTALTENDIFSVTVSATCTPQASYSDKGGDIPAQSVNVNGFTFEKSTQSGAGAGSYDDISIYQANNNDACYEIRYAAHGPNGAGAYTTDPSQAISLETAFGNDVANVRAIVDSMLSTFAFINTPAGQSEASYSAQQSQQAAGQSGSSGSSPTSGIINLSSISSSTVSVGSSVTLNGSGFLGHDTIVWISNGSVNGVLWGGMPTSDTSITSVIPVRACTQYTGASGVECPSYLILSPGTYTVSVANQNGTTDQTYIRIQ